MQIRGWDEDQKKFYAQVTKLYKLLDMRVTVYLNRLSFILYVLKKQVLLGSGYNKQGSSATMINPDKTLNILQTIVKGPRNSILKVAQQYNIDHTSVYKILKKEKFH